MVAHHAGAATETAPPSDRQLPALVFALQHVDCEALGAGPRLSVLRALVAAERDGALPAGASNLTLGLSSQPGEVIGLLGSGSPEWIAAFLGIVRAGALAMPINEHMSDQELDRVLAHSNCRRVITFAARLKSFATLERPLSEIFVLEDEAELEPIEGSRVCRWSDLIGDEPARLPELAAEQPAALLYTSGTTGTPKGVPLSHENLCSNVEALRAARLATPEDRAFVPLPLHHAYPLTVGVLAPLACHVVWTGLMVAFPVVRERAAEAV